MSLLLSNTVLVCYILLYHWFVNFILNGLWCIYNAYIYMCVIVVYLYMTGVVGVAHHHMGKGQVWVRHRAQLLALPANRRGPSRPLEPAGMLSDGGEVIKLQKNMAPL